MIARTNTPRHQDTMGADRVRAARLPFVARLLLLAVALAISGAAPSIASAQAGGLAPAGPCAEPREAIAGGAASDFSVVGPIAALLSPVDVAAEPAAVAALAPPSSTELTRPGSCDVPGSGCGIARIPEPPTTKTNKPIRPGSRGKKASRRSKR